MLHNQRNHKIFERLSKSLIHLEIQRTRISLWKLSIATFNTHLKLASAIKEDLWRIIDASAALKASKERQVAELRHMNKLQKLQQRWNNENCSQHEHNLGSSSTNHIIYAEDYSNLLEADDNASKNGGLIILHSP